MWPLCTANSFLWVLIPLLIGLLTGWWAWARRGAQPLAAVAAPVIDRPALRPIPEPTPPPAPVVAPLAAAAALTAIGIPASVGVDDDLQMIKGVGPALSDMLHGLGVHRFDQIAAWGPEEVAKVEAHLGSFQNRIERDRWVEQAGLLARGEFAEHEARFGMREDGH
jgi:predicted flap endonuclease-1-like 5' DNA nuclease